MGAATLAPGDLANAGSAVVPRDRTSTSTIERELKIEIDRRWSELGALERAFDVLQRAHQEDPERCSESANASPCSGLMYTRWCRRCGVVVRRCAGHGGQPACATILRHHTGSHECDDDDRSGAARAASADPRRLLAGGTTVPVGRMPAPPAHRTRASRGPEAANDHAERLGEAPRQSPSIGTTVIRRRARGS